MYIGQYDLHVTNRRLETRNPVMFPVHCRLGGSATSGYIRDLSERGAFIEAVVDDTSSPVVEFSFVSLIDVNDQFVLNYDQRQYDPPIYGLATIKWMGYSKTHKCSGFGIQFDVD